MAEPQERVEAQPQSPQRRERRRYVSERGPFEIRANPEIRHPRPKGTTDEARALQIFEHSDLAEQYGEAPVAEKIIEMHKALADGITSTSLFAQRDTPGGMTLSHVWMGANFLIYRHSHPKGGDCLYYVVAGEVSLGRRKLRAGSTIFLPSGMPYKFRAGPAGAEVLEFRAGGGDPNAPGLKLEERSLDSLQHLIDEGKAHRDGWVVPEKIGDTALRQAVMDARAGD